MDNDTASINFKSKIKLYKATFIIWSCVHNTRQHGCKRFIFFW